jgi:hypothetical protein
MDEALALRIELASVTEAAALRNGTDIPDIEEADEARPVRRWLSLSMWLDDGRRSGKRALTKVTMSAGESTMNGWTSTVSLGDVMAFAGSKMGFEGVLVCLNRAKMFSICVRISGSIGTFFCLKLLLADGIGVIQKSGRTSYRSCLQHISAL